MRKTKKLDMQQKKTARKDPGGLTIEDFR